MADEGDEPPLRARVIYRLGVLPSEVVWQAPLRARVIKRSGNRVSVQIQLGAESAVVAW